MKLGFWQKFGIGAALDLIALSLGMVAGGLIPALGTISGPVYAGILLVLFELVSSAI